MRKLLTKFFLFLGASVLLLPTGLNAREDAATTAIGGQEVPIATSQSQMPMYQQQLTTTEQKFLHSSKAGTMATMILYNPETLAEHSYVTAVGYIMEYLGKNKKDATYHDVRFQGGEYAIAATDVERFFTQAEIASVPHYIKDEQGQLLHYIEDDPLVVNSWSYVAELGDAPSWMETNKKYYSFNGIYFVDDITKLGEYKADKNSVNKEQPYYNYYQYLPLRSKTSYTANELNNGFHYLYTQTGREGLPTAMRASALTFLATQEKYGINALSFMAIAMNESAYGTSGYALEDNNLFGYNAVDSYPDNADKFPSVTEGTHEVANLISWSYGDAAYEEGRNYYGFHLGNKASGMNVKYASDPFWGEKAVSNMVKMDNYLGKKDFQKYQIALAKQDSKVSAGGFWKSKLFKYKKSTSTLAYMYPVIIQEQPQGIFGWTKIDLEPAYDGDLTLHDVAEDGGVYHWLPGYIRKKNLLFIEAEDNGGDSK